MRYAEGDGRLRIDTAVVKNALGSPKSRSAKQGSPCGASREKRLTILPIATLEGLNTVARTYDFAALRQDEASAPS